MPRETNHSWSKGLRKVVARFPQDVLEIARRYQCDDQFRSICHDYADACAALERWQRTACQGDRRTLDYRRLVDELELELLSILRPMESQH